MAAQGLVDVDAVVWGLVQGQLEHTEERGISRDGSGDEAKFPEDALPGFTQHWFSVAEVGEDLGECFLAMWGKLNGLSKGVDDPS